MAAVIKTTLVIHSFIVGLLIARFDELEPTMAETIGGSLMVLFGMPLAIFIVIKANMGVGYIEPPWKRPHWSDNPLSFATPLPFLQFGMIYFGAWGCGSLISMIWMGLEAVHWTMVGLCGSAGIYLGWTWLEARYARPKDRADKEQSNG